MSNEHDNFSRKKNLLTKIKRYNGKKFKTVNWINTNMILVESYKVASRLKNNSKWILYLDPDEQENIFICKIVYHHRCCCCAFPSGRSHFYLIFFFILFHFQFIFFLFYLDSSTFSRLLSIYCAFFFLNFLFLVPVVNLSTVWWKFFR